MITLDLNRGEQRDLALVAAWEMQVADGIYTARDGKLLQFVTGPDCFEAYIWLSNEMVSSQLPRRTYVWLLETMRNALLMSFAVSNRSEVCREVHS